MDYAIGIVLALAAGALGSVVGFDRGRSFYPVVMIVIACTYGLFAAMAGSEAALWRDALVGLLFAAVAIAGFRTSLWLVVAALAGHGAMDLVHGDLVANPGVPLWWPGFCAAYDVTAAAYLSVVIGVRGEPRQA